MLCLFSVEAVGQIQPECDTTLLSERVEGDYLVRRYKIERSGDEAQYTLHYRIDASQLNQLNEANAEQLMSLEEFLTKLRSDTTINISHIEVVGYASPDGSEAANEALALSRAQKFRALLENRYSLASDYVVKVRADVEPWQACDKAVEGSSLENKQAVLNLLNSSQTPSAKEQQLKRMPEVWSLFRTAILPPMRRVEMVAYYSTDAYVEVRTLLNKPRADATPQLRRCCPCRAIVVDESIGIIVDMQPEGYNY